MGVMDAAQIGWLAGIIEGEGSIRVRSNNSNVEIVVKMTDEDVVRRLQQVTGVGSILGPFKRDAIRKPQWTWSCSNRRDVARVLLAIYPLMGVRRKARIAQAVENFERRQREPAKCGTTGGYHKHLRLKEPTCAACREAVRLTWNTPQKRAARKDAASRYRAKVQASHIYVRFPVGGALPGEPTCSTEGCPRAAKVRGMCGAHYQQDWKARTCSA